MVSSDAEFPARGGRSRAIGGCSSLLCGDDVGCGDSVAVAIVASGSRALSDGRWSIDAKLDGVAIRNDCTLAQGSSTCSSADSVVSRGAAGMVVVTLFGAPKHVDLTVSFDGTAVVTTSFDPVYQKSQPNGESCPPTCHNATHAAGAQ